MLRTAAGDEALAKPARRAGRRSGGLAGRHRQPWWHDEARIGQNKITRRGSARHEALSTARPANRLGLHSRGDSARPGRRRSAADLDTEAMAAQLGGDQPAAGAGAHAVLLLDQQQAAKRAAASRWPSPPCSPESPVSTSGSPRSRQPAVERIFGLTNIPSIMAARWKRNRPARIIMSIGLRDWAHGLIDGNLG